MGGVSVPSRAVAGPVSGGGARFALRAVDLTTGSFKADGAMPAALPGVCLVANSRIGTSCCATGRRRKGRLRGGFCAKSELGKAAAAIERDSAVSAAGGVRS